MSDRRFFNSRERAALYIAADGKCRGCGTALEPGWHADHITPHSRGGATDLVNGSALCAACNLRKGSRTIMTELRPWQREALNRYLAADKRDFLAVACPGAGKTTWALTVARTLLDRGTVRRVVVIVPSDALRTQWSDNTSAGVDLRPYVSGPVDKDGYHGVVTTYQALGGVTGGVLRNVIGEYDNTGTLVILDEIHHAADTSSYGEALGFAFERATRRLSLTGTPWRTDSREKMPFVSFDDKGMLHVDYSYDYGRAVADGACRRIDFPVVDGQAKWVRDLERREESLTVERRLKGVDKSDALRSILDATATGKWFADVIVRAHRDLTSMRRETPDAAGLIVAKDKVHAKKIAKRLKELTGVTAPVVVSAEDGEAGSNGDARGTIERFRDSRDPWIIAVKMIAEGVDIPRLMVGIYATNVSTSMFFNQVVGRFVRIRPGEQVTSRLYVPPSFELWAIILEIQKTLPQRLDESDVTERKREGAAAGSTPSDYTPVASEANGLSMVRTHDGNVEGDLVGNWTNFLDQRGIPTHWATAAASSGVLPPAPTAVMERTVPTHRREKELRDEIKALVGRVAYRCYDDHTAGQQVYRDLWRVFGRSVKDMSLGDLERAVSYMEDALESGEEL